MGLFYASRPLRVRAAERFQHEDPERPGLVGDGLANLPDRPVGYGYAYAFGWVAPQIARLQLRFQDGSSTDITLHDRYYLYVVPPANWPAGHRPSILERRDVTQR